jgi:hypothetical protein
VITLQVNAAPIALDIKLMIKESTSDRQNVSHFINLRTKASIIKIIGKRRMELVPNKKNSRGIPASNFGSKNTEYISASQNSTCQ